MQKVLVTGATGCIGSNLVAELVRSGYTVRAFHRKASTLVALDGIDAEHVTGDVLDEDSLRRAVRGCDTVFHCAAKVSFWKRERDEQMEVNVRGTRNVVNACIAGGVAKLVHTSSVAALGYREDGELMDETTAFNWGADNPYKYSKHLAELELLKGAGQGLDAVIVNPTVVVGQKDAYVHGGQIVLDAKRGRIPAYIRGGMNVVDVDDVVRGHLAAARQGRRGERYILGGWNLTHRDIFRMAARIVGGRAPMIRVPIWALRGVARIADAAGTMMNRKPWITPELVSSAGRNNWYSSAKAERELGHTAAPIEDAMRRAMEWYVGAKMM